jgi:hypothetical protein
MQSDLEVDTQILRSCVRPLHDLAATVRSTDPPPTPSLPRWSTAEAAAALADLTRVRGKLLATDLDSAADRLAAVADDYDRADEQVADRLRAVR